MFKEVLPQMNLPETEKKTLDFWDTEKIFEKSLEKTKDMEPYHFYDGPPFATGTPHYGHIVASTMKDVVPRYWTMRGRFVERKWGWDCHGLPIENIAEKKLGIKQKKDIEQIGVDKFNQTCRSMVLEYVGEWESVMRRLGRWADMKNSYKTMDTSYMESVWWVFKKLYDNDLIYKDYRSMHICPRCETTLSQSEVTEGYKDIKDLSAIAKFHLKTGQIFGGNYETKESDYILAWTTTPWTLLGNVALAVGSKIKYSAVRINGIDETYLVATNRIKDIFKDNEIEIVYEDLSGEDLTGLEYEPLFDMREQDDYVKNPSVHNNGWKVYIGEFVTTEEGTGVVHIAPAFGDDDLRLGQKFKLPFIQHVGMDGIIKTEFEPFAGLSVKPLGDHMATDIEIIKDLSHRGLLFSKEKYEHSYPHCWRCDTPLLNYATSSWFVGVTKMKDRMLENAKEINWSPKHIKNGRFGKWLEGARDWSISRQRYWASCMPIWECECGERIVIGSVAELERLSGAGVLDLHKDVLDKILIPCEKCDKKMKRVPDVLDTWFDSGSMPYAQLHYPFENQEKFDKSFPAEFIAEGQDQCRAWFYYLHTIATGVSSSIAFKNVIVNGIVLAEDGKKMSKRLQNYPDPMLMFDKYGADSVRMYLLTSPVMQAENLNFSEKEVAEISRGMLRMLWNSYSFFILYANIDGWSPNVEVVRKEPINSTNILDRWVISELNKLCLEVNNGMESYDLTRTTRLFAPFVDNLSNWYIRRSRKRFWKSENDGDKNNAYQTLWTVLTELSKLLAPFAPFIAEEIFTNLTSQKSVHLESYPVAETKLIDQLLNEKMERVRKIVEMGLSARATAKIKVRQPLSLLQYHGDLLESELTEIIAEEVNVKMVSNAPGEINTVTINTEITSELKIEGYSREIIRNIQALRKNRNFNIDDRIEVSYESDASELIEAINLDIVAKEVLANRISSNVLLENSKVEYNIDGKLISIGIDKKTV
ncbi:MAG: isoleucine--tRNA ligase [bacterium]